MIVEIAIGGQIIKILGVHLKSSCHQWQLNQVIDQSPSHGGLFRTRFDCRTLRAQLSVLENWVEQQSFQKIPIVIMGDFNRRFNSVDGVGNPNDDFWNDLNDGTPTGLNLIKGPEGKDSVCWPNHVSRFDDHIDFVVYEDDLKEKANISVASKKSMGHENDPRYAEKERQKLSDHCPVVTEINSTQ